ncbi:MAG: hypothetical protein ACI83B_001032 [Sediminicola sp.]|jgi:hypothetical protein
MKGTVYIHKFKIIISWSGKRSKKEARLNNNYLKLKQLTKLNKASH